MRKAGWNGARAGFSRASTKDSKNQVVCARCHLVGLASGIDWIAQSSALSGAASARVAARTSWKRRASSSASGAEAASRIGCCMRAPPRRLPRLCDRDFARTRDDLAHDGGGFETFRTEDREHLVASLRRAGDQQAAAGLRIGEHRAFGLAQLPFQLHAFAVPGPVATRRAG